MRPLTAAEQGEICRDTFERFVKAAPAGVAEDAEWWVWMFGCIDSTPCTFCGTGPAA